MARRSTSRKARGRARKASARRTPGPKPRKGARARRGWWRRYRRSPGPVQLVVGLAAMALLALAINWTYQVIRKPSELLFPISGTLYKTPAETWREYAPSFRAHSTAVMTPEMLAAIAQIEGSGNPVVRTYWRWTWTSQPFEVYRPASSAVGMYQFTDGTFAEARHFCIHDHHVVEDGPWDHWRSCWFNRFYARVIPSHAVELASAYLDWHVALALERHGRSHATLQQKQDLAAMIHLCGAGAGEEYARRGFRLLEGQRCGDHEARDYLARINAMKAVFVALDRRARSGAAPG